MTVKTSTDGTKYMLDLATNTLIRNEKALANLIASDTIVVPVRVALTDEEKAAEKLKPYGHRESSKIRKVTVKASDVYTDPRDGYTIEGVFVPDATEGRFLVFKDEKIKQIRDIERFIEMVKKDIAFFQTKIAEWTP